MKVPYELNNSLFSDYASKRRTVYVPKPARYKAKGVFDFPVGTVFSKTFHYGERVIETRILVRTPAGWVGLPYVWNEAQTEAVLQIEGGRVNVDLERKGKKQTIEYFIPNSNQCLSCHMENDKMAPIGPTASHLNKADQLTTWAKRGFLAGLPKQVPAEAVWDDPASGNLEARARAYLDINCAHCHRPEGPARSSGLFLSGDVKDRETLGIMKRPVAAGIGSGDLYYGIVPGAPEKSILVFRMASVQPKIMMPEIGRTIVDEEGLELIRAWIGQLK